MPMENRVGRSEKERFEVNVMGTVRTGSGKPIQAEITDLSENGCACTVGTVWMQSSDHASLRIGDLGPIDATIRWVNDRQVGIEFHRPVYGRCSSTSARSSIKPTSDGIGAPRLSI